MDYLRAQNGNETVKRQPLNSAMPDAAAAAAAVVLRPRSPARWIVYLPLHSPVRAKMAALLALLMACSALCALDLGPASALADPRNPLNRYLAKFSWGWTLVCVLPVNALCAFLYCALEWRAAAGHVARVGVAHAVWFGVTSLVDAFVLPLGFDVSGHVFLLSYCIWVLTEECSGVRLELWREFPSALQLQERVVDKLSQRRRALLPRLHTAMGWLVELWELMGVAEVITWYFIFAVSCLYFHSLVEKLAGYGLSCLAWYLTYGLLYGRPFFPRQPHDAPLHPLKAVMAVPQQ